MTDAANTTQTQQQFSSQQSQSGSSDQGQNGGSSLTPATRPDYIPEAYWDAPTNTVKAAEFTTHIGQLAATQAAHDARIAARPEKPEGYELKFSDAFKPEIAVAFNETDPRVAPLRALAHELNLGQGEFSKLLEIEAGRVAAEDKAYKAAADAEMKKLGANGSARVTATKSWLTGILGADAAASVIDRMVLASDIEALEKLQLAFTNQGGSTYSNGGRDAAPPPPKRREEILYPNMTARKGS